MLRKKFSGKTSYNNKTGELTLAYDFKSKEQLKDFKIGEATVAVTGGVLSLRAADSIQHIVSFKSASIGGNFAPGGDEFAIFVSRSASVRFKEWPFVELFSAGEPVAHRDEFKHAWPMPIQYDVSETKVRVVFAGQELAGRRKNADSVGHFTLSGGNSGLAVSSLIISGVPEESWLKEFLGE